MTTSPKAMSANEISHRITRRMLTSYPAPFAVSALPYVQRV